jgi:hypothetical protein
LKRLVGSTLEELAADADTLLKEWGPASKAADDDDDDLGADPSTTPKTGLKNPGDPKPTEGRFDADTLADEYYATSRGGF